MILETIVYILAAKAGKDLVTETVTEIVQNNTSAAAEKAVFDQAVDAKVNEILVEKAAEEKIHGVSKK